MSRNHRLLFVSQSFIHQGFFSQVFQNDPLSPIIARLRSQSFIHQGFFSQITKIFIH